MRYPLILAALLLASPCLAASKHHAAAASDHDEVFAGRALVCKGDARDNGSCTIIKVEPPPGLSRAACDKAWSRLRLAPGATLLGARCLTLREVEGLLPHVAAAPSADAPAAEAPPAAAAPPDDDQIHGSTDGWRHV